jgi:hypothetical protein
METKDELADSNIAGCEAQRLRTVGSGEGRQVVVCGGEMANTNYRGREQDGFGRGMGKVCDRGEDIFMPITKSGALADSDSAQLKGRGISSGIYSQHSNSICPSWWDVEPDVGRVAHGVAARVDRLKAIGNGQVPLVAATAWSLLK